MDTHQIPAPGPNPTMPPDPLEATADNADRERAPDPSTKTDRPDSAESPQYGADAAELSSPEAQDPDAMEAADPAAARTSRAAGPADRDDPSEGDAEEPDTGGTSVGFDPAAFDAALNQVLSSAGGELLFRFAEDTAAGEKIAAVRLGDGEARLIALVILPPHGAPLRVEPVEESANPLAHLAKSYASLVDAWKSAA